MCLRGRGKYERVYISTERGENSYCYIDRPYGL